MNQLATQRAVGSRVKVRPTLGLPKRLLIYVGYLGYIVHVIDHNRGVRYALVFGDGWIVYCTDEQLA